MKEMNWLSLEYRIREILRKLRNGELVSLEEAIVRIDYIMASETKRGHELPHEYVEGLLWENDKETTVSKIEKIENEEWNKV